MTETLPSDRAALLRAAGFSGGEVADYEAKIAKGPDETPDAYLKRTAPMRDPPPPSQAAQPPQDETRRPWAWQRWLQDLSLPQFAPAYIGPERLAEDRKRLKSVGYSDAEIDKALSVPVPPQEHRGIIDALKGMVTGAPADAPVLTLPDVVRVQESPMAGPEITKFDPLHWLPLIFSGDERGKLAGALTDVFGPSDSQREAHRRAIGALVHHMPSPAGPLDLP